jgi:hypothetical protein
MHLRNSLMKQFPNSERWLSVAGVVALLALVGSMFAIAANAASTARSIGVTIPAGNGEAIALYKGSYALVLGNSRYKNGLDPLPGVAQDVADVARALEHNGFAVTVKTDLNRSEFQRAVEEFALRYGSDTENRLLFYYAGHGYTEQTATGEAVGYLMMVDAPHPDRDRLGFRLASVDMQYFITQSKLIQAKHVLFLFDSCFSGTILNFRAAVRPQAVSDAVRYPVRQFITAGRANEPVPDRSVFKQAFVDILEGRAKEPIEDGYLTGEELGLYLKITVPRYSPNQNPQYGKIRDIRLDNGDFVFAIDPAKRHAATGRSTRELVPPATELANQQAQLEEQKRITLQQQAQLAAMQAEIERLKKDREHSVLPKKNAQQEEEHQELASSKKKTEAANAPATFDKTKPWQGLWEFRSGTYTKNFCLNLIQDGDRVRSKSTGDALFILNGRIKGTRITGNVEWYMGNFGNLSATMAPDGNSFKGTTSWQSMSDRFKAIRIE